MPNETILGTSTNVSLTVRVDDGRGHTDKTYSNLHVLVRDLTQALPLGIPKIVIDSPPTTGANNHHFHVSTDYLGDPNKLNYEWDWGPSNDDQSDPYFQRITYP